MTDQDNSQSVNTSAQPEKGSSKLLRWMLIFMVGAGVFCVIGFIVAFITAGRVRVFDELQEQLVNDSGELLVSTITPLPSYNPDDDYFITEITLPLGEENSHELSISVPINANLLEQGENTIVVDNEDINLAFTAKIEDWSSNHYTSVVPIENPYYEIYRVALTTNRPDTYNYVINNDFDQTSNCESVVYGNAEAPCGYQYLTEVQDDVTQFIIEAVCSPATEVDLEQCDKIMESFEVVE